MCKVIGDEEVMPTSWAIDNARPAESSITDASKLWRLLGHECDYRLELSDGSDGAINSLVAKYDASRNEIIRQMAMADAASLIEIRAKVDTAMKIIEWGDTDDKIGMGLLASARFDISRFEVQQSLAEMERAV